MLPAAYKPTDFFFLFLSDIARMVLCILASSLYTIYVREKKDVVRPPVGIHILKQRYPFHDLASPWI
jgi:hypothetical protein